MRGGARGRICRRRSAEGVRVVESSPLRRTSVGGRGRPASAIAAAPRGRGNCTEADAAAAHSGAQGVVMAVDARLAGRDDAFSDEDWCAASVEEWCAEEGCPWSWPECPSACSPGVSPALSSAKVTPQEPSSCAGLPAQQDIVQRCSDDSVKASGTTPDTRAAVSVAAISIRATSVRLNLLVRKSTCMRYDTRKRLRENTTVKRTAPPK